MQLQMAVITELLQQHRSVNVNEVDLKRKVRSSKDQKLGKQLLFRKVNRFVSSSD